jgi:hypothetical protein
MLDRIRLILYAFDNDVMNEEELTSVLTLYETLSETRRQDLVYPRLSRRLDGKDGW